jgi:hypothetical protein
VLGSIVLHELVLPVVFDGTELALVWLVLWVTSFVIFAISNSGECLLTIPTRIRLDASVGPLVDEEVALLGKDLAASNSVAFEQVLTTVGGLLMKIQSWCPRKTFIASLHVADVPINIFMASLVMFEVLFKLEGLATFWVRAFELSVWKMSSDMGLKIPGLGKLSFAFVEGAVETSLMVLNLRLDLFDDCLIF